jgi:hypothetical protein
VHLPERKERALVSLDVTNGHTVDPWSRCEFGKTPFSEGECPRPGEDRLDGSLLCVPHAKLLRLQAQEDTLLDMVLELDKWLENPSNRADELGWRRALRDRDEAVEHLRFNRILIDAHKELDP